MNEGKQSLSGSLCLVIHQPVQVLFTVVHLFLTQSGFPMPLWQLSSNASQKQQAEPHLNVPFVCLTAMYHATCHQVFLILGDLKSYVSPSGRSTPAASFITMRVRCFQILSFVHLFRSNIGCALSFLTRVVADFSSSMSRSHDLLTTMLLDLYVPCDCTVPPCIQSAMRHVSSHHFISFVYHLFHQQFSFPS